MASHAELPVEAPQASERVRSLEAEIRTLELQLEQLAAIIQQYRTERPAVADIFPDDELVQSWKRQGDKLQERSQALRARLGQCRLELNAAKTDEREEITKKLAAISAELEQLEPEFARMEKQINRARELRAVRQEEVDQISEQIRQSEAGKPRCADYLPDSPKVKTWRKKHDELQRMLQEAIGRREKSQQGCPDTLQARKVADQVEQLKRAERNLLNQLEGAQPGPQGGVSSVA